LEKASDNLGESKEVFDRSEHYRIRVHRKSRAHYLTAKRYNRLNNWLGIPVVILTAIVGSAIFVSLSENPAVELRIATGFLSVLATVLASLQTFFKFPELAEKHSVSGAGYTKLKRKIDSVQLKFRGKPTEREAFIEELDRITDEISKLDSDSKDIPDSIYDKAVIEQKSDEEGV